MEIYLNLSTIVIVTLMMIIAGMIIGIAMARRR